MAESTKIPSRVKKISEQSPEITKRIASVFSKVYEEHIKRISSWNEIDSFVYGDDDARKKVTAPYRMKSKSRLYINRVRRAYNTLVSSISRRSPGMFILPSVEGSETIELWSRYLNRELNAILVRNKYPKQFLAFVGQSLAYGIAFQRVTWDPSLADGAGGVRIRTPQSRNIILPPGVYDPADADYVFEINWMSIPKLIRTYPEHVDAIEELAKSASTSSSTSRSIGEMLASVLGTAVGPKDPLSGKQSSTIVVSDNTVMRRTGSETLFAVVTAWFNDDTVIEEMIEEEVVRAYPYGRVITFVSDILLEDKPNPTPFVPYVPLINEAIPGTGRPFSEVRDMIEIQKLYGLTVNKANDAMSRYVGGPRIFYDSVSKFAPNLTTGDPGEAVAVGSLSGIEREPPFVMSPDIYRLISLYRADFDEVSGVQDIMQGRAGDLRSGFAVQAISELADANLSPKLQVIEAAVMDIMSYVIRMMALFYQPGKHYPEDIGDIRGISPELFRMVVKLGTNSTLTGPNRDLFILQLFDRRIVDEEFVLDNLTDLVGEDRLKERILARKQQEELIAQQQQGA